MPYMIGHHRNEDYARWKQSFDAGMPKRAEFGSKGTRVFTSADDPNEVWVLVEFATVEEARGYATWASAPEHREIFRNAGVIPPFDRFFVEERGQTSA